MAAVTITTGPEAMASSVANATDIAGSISITTTPVAGIICTLNYGTTTPYADIGSGLSACQVIITPTNADAATDMDKIYISSNTTTGFVVSMLATCIVSAHTYNYHVIETQATNGSFGAITTTTYAAGSQSRSNCTDVAGRVTILTTSASGSVTFPFGYTYTTAPIVIISPLNASHFSTNLIYVTSTINDFTIHVTSPGGVYTLKYAYHCIETQP